MTILTGVGRADVGGVLAGGVHAIVAACAISGNAGVIKNCTVPCVGSMAIFTSIATGDVISRFTFSSGSIVAR